MKVIYVQNWFERAIVVQALKIWRRNCNKIPNLGLLDVIRLRSVALNARGLLDAFIRGSDERILRSEIKSSGFQKPADADWAWRPELWSSPIDRLGVASARSNARLGKEARLFHDCKMADLTIKQFRNLRNIDLSPFGFVMEVFDFDGSYLSLAIAFPKEAATGMKTKHIVDLEAIIESERPVKISARLNVKHGPNIEQIIREFSHHGAVSSLGFDLGYLLLNESRIREVWLDLIFEAPQMNQIKIRDLTFYRRPRSGF